MAEAEIIKLTFKLREMFPPADPLSVPLLRLMAATNDARQIMTLLLEEEEIAESGSSEQLIQNGEIGYLLRMLCGHLYEAGSAFRELDSKYAAQVDKFFSLAPEFQSDLGYLRAVYNDVSDQGFNKAVLNPIRTFGAFHYKHLRFDDYLRNAEDQGTIIVAEYAGMSRYVVADNIMTAFVLGLVGRDLQSYLGIHDKAFKLVHSLGVVVDCLLTKLLEDRPTAILDHTSEVLEIPPPVQKTRERLAGQKKGGA